MKPQLHHDAVGLTWQLLAPGVTRSHSCICKVRAHLCRQNFLTESMKRETRPREDLIPRLEPCTGGAIPTGLRPRLVSRGPRCCGVDSISVYGAD
ncbi:hypothetical protein VFPFJ_07616 [Purpureocillium lilacinum]|uniref:Uncharacterized protein n=1 Tax=Purpureocillium lilacinum TaxID=33203 RepID=A0A179H4Z2_PURLI|nr:hypothetical protein VFPFJ_07616 [Purpureocillium lilacinum]OAQ85227.1 hypothetical protein VFPFJ_07616 [Purpureocillium lilacinum]